MTRKLAHWNLYPTLLPDALLTVTQPLKWGLFDECCEKCENAAGWQSAFAPHFNPFTRPESLNYGVGDRVLLASIAGDAYAGKYATIEALSEKWGFDWLVRVDGLLYPVNLSEREFFTRVPSSLSFGRWG